MNCDANENTLYHILVLGQSLSMGYATGSPLPSIEENAYMFRRVRTQDFGYVFGIGRDEYYSNADQWDSQFYEKLLPLQETGGDGDASKAWESASPNEYETPCSGIVLGLNDAYRTAGGTGTPYSVLVSAPGIGGTPISSYAPASNIYDRAVKDIQNGKRLAEEQGLSYAVLAIVWVQGENNYGSASPEAYAAELLARKQEYTDMVRSITGQEGEIPFVTYQTMAQMSYYGHVTQHPALGQLSAVQQQADMAMSATCYQFATYNDRIHLTNISSRNMGILLGHALYRLLHNERRVLTPTEVISNGNIVTLRFDTAIALNADGVLASHDEEVIRKNGGFFCYNGEDQLLDITFSLSSDQKELTLTAAEPIASVSYGFDAFETDWPVYSYGGIVCDAQAVSGTTGDLHEYMPVQWILQRSK